MYIRTNTLTTESSEKSGETETTLPKTMRVQSPLAPENVPPGIPKCVQTSHQHGHVHVDASPHTSAPTAHTRQRSGCVGSSWTVKPALLQLPPHRARRRGQVKAEGTRGPALLCAQRRGAGPGAGGGPCAEAHPGR